MAFDVVGGSGLTVTSAYPVLPGGKGGDDGFVNNTALNGVGLYADQTVGGLFQGVGLTAGSSNGYSWSAPVELAYGTYVGYGAITLQPDFQVG
jgi:hypothetical protein